MSARPDSIPPVDVQASNPRDARGKYFVPFRSIIVNNTLEVGEINDSGGIANHVEVPVVRLVFLGRVIPEERHTLLRESREKYPQHAYDPDRAFPFPSIFICRSHTRLLLQYNNPILPA